MSKILKKVFLFPKFEDLHFCNEKNTGGIQHTKHWKERKNDFLA